MTDRTVRIIVGEITLEAEWDDTPTADLVYDALPLSARGSYWGDELYFPIPVKADQEPGASDVVEVGEIAFWPPGNCLCLFWGPTPASQGNECRAADPVNVVGRVLNVDDLKRITATGVMVEIS
ncbi:MAG: cyclophilin-like fold protein [Acidobacteria bacterium]|nr:cyclophilin-like fold protein [Acidobacteriota bacterium]MDA1236368.1 cyclophilin-like fold protein [Acidobacteriota bacterium]